MEKTTFSKAVSERPTVCCGREEGLDKIFFRVFDFCVFFSSEKSHQKIEENQAKIEQRDPKAAYRHLHGLLGWESPNLIP